MINKELIETLVETTLNASIEFLVSVSISPTNDIRVVIDSLEGLSIDRCIAVSRAIEASLNRDEEDFSLEVMSAGLGEPFLNPRQYQKNIGNTVSVILKNGLKEEGKLVEVNENAFVISLQKIIPAHIDADGKKHKKETIMEQHSYLFDEVKSTAYRFEK